MGEDPPGAQAAGFSLEEVKQLLKVMRQDGTPCGQVREALGMKLAALESRLSEIELLVKVLKTTLGTPDGVSSPFGCNLMESLLVQTEGLSPRTFRA